MSKFFQSLVIVALAAGMPLGLSAEPTTPLDTIAAIRSLSTEQAVQGKPIRINGVITFYTDDSQQFVVSDNDQSIYVHTELSGPYKMAALSKEERKRLKPGAIVEVEGITGVGQYAPIIYPKHIQFLGTTNLPRPIQVTLPDLLTGVYDAQWISLRGIIQRIDFLDKKYGFQILLATEKGNGHVLCQCANFNPKDRLRYLDASVELQGVAFTGFNQRGEAASVGIKINAEKDITILTPPLADAFATPKISLENLRTFSTNLDFLHRQCLEGTVTFSQSGKFFYLQEGDRAVRVTTRQTNQLAAGDRVLASGYVEMSHINAELHEAVYRVIGTNPVPPAIPLTWDQTMTATRFPLDTKRLDYDGRLVRISGNVEQVDLRSPNGPRMWVNQDGRTIVIWLGSDVTPQAAASWEVGSVVSLTGICMMQYSDNRPPLNFTQPVGFEVFLRSPDDVVVKAHPSWWTARRLTWALFTTGGILALSVGWIFLLRRAVTKQTTRLEHEMKARHNAELEFKATLRERTRIAADLHDTLEQGLTATAYQLEVERARRCDPPPPAARHIDLAFDLLNRSRDDLRRSVWALRSGILEGRSFDEALQTLTGRTELSHNISCACTVQNNSRTRIGEFEANHLLMFVQEAVANAIKHASAKHLEITALVEPTRITISVSDDGVGFNPKTVCGPQDGHFGLLGMKERVTQLNGTLEIFSSPNQGTKIQASVPLPNSSSDEEKLRDAIPEADGKR
jgi:signal transduction histidine kinase